MCAARNEISKQITKLQGLTFSSSTVTEAKAGFEAIGKDLTKIKNEQSALASPRKEQVQRRPKPSRQSSPRSLAAWCRAYRPATSKQS